ncbi:mechanosensitive ion channel protein 2, chloroplastic-like isoform X2 [Miscanthus floridulus]|uniref:mechanosensitive ion channel protein 2, chloroplastic-like isoform X2 n=1 Tax=Miscanthus floridulus TaxID=154761 RepID=UPI00345A5035
MAVGLTSQLFQRVTATDIFCQRNKFRSPEMRSCLPLPSTSFPSVADRRYCWDHNVLESSYRPMLYAPRRYRSLGFRSCALPVPLKEIPLVKNASLALTRSCDTLLANPATSLVVPAIGIIVFALWGFLPLVWDIRNRFDHGGNWKKSPTYLISSSYLQPLLLWTGATLICSLIQQVQKFLMDMRNPNDARNMGFDFTMKALYTGVWIAAFSLFMELLGFNTQKWITAGGFGTVLLTLAGREIFTNFLSSIMINATRPFVVNEWIDAKIDGVDVSGIVEHVGLWSPTIIRGVDREAIYIPNHKFTVSILRNNTQRTHWRIKTYLAISHMDAGKIGTIVADMRKVLAKNPHIEQQKLHRRVFFEKIDPKNQALMGGLIKRHCKIIHRPYFPNGLPSSRINLFYLCYVGVLISIRRTIKILVSCFVKTSHFEEFLNVQEAVMLDLLRIVGHHKTRLATQIRTVQKSYGNADFDNIPFGEDMYSRIRGRPLLIDTSARISDDKPKPRPVSSREEQKVKTNGSVETKSASPENASLSNSEKQEQKKVVPEDARVKNIKSDNVTPVTPSLDPATSTSTAGKGKTREPEPTERQGDGSVLVANPKKESRPVFEDNIVLGVALEGSKRTLPIEEGNPYQSLSETELDTEEAASSPKDKIGQSPKL